MTKTILPGSYWRDR